VYLFGENYYELNQEEGRMDLLKVTLLAFEHNQKISHLKKIQHQAGEHTITLY